MTLISNSSVPSPIALRCLRLTDRKLSFGANQQMQCLSSKTEETTAAPSKLGLFTLPFNSWYTRKPICSETKGTKTQNKGNRNPFPLDLIVFTLAGKTWETDSNKNKNHQWCNAIKSSNWMDFREEPKKTRKRKKEAEPERDFPPQHYPNIFLDIFYPVWVPLEWEENGCWSVQ